MKSKGYRHLIAEMHMKGMISVSPDSYIFPYIVHVCMLNCFSHVLILCDLMDCSLLGSSVHEILQERILEGVAMPSSRGSS